MRAVFRFIAKISDCLWLMASFEDCLRGVLRLGVYGQVRILQSHWIFYCTLSNDSECCYLWASARLSR